jgi:hypothetical protein
VYIEEFAENYHMDFHSIFNLQQKSDFIYSNYSHAKDETIGGIINTFNTIGVFENQYKKDLIDFNFEDIVSLFERNGWKKTSTFNRNKSVLVSYIDWCRINGKLSGNVHSIERLQFDDITGQKKFEIESFKSFEDLKDCANSVYNSEGVNDSDKFIIDISVLYLSWIGFKKEEIQRIKKDDISFINNTINSKLFSYKVSNVNQYIMDVLSICVNIEGYTTNNRFGEANRKYNENEFLIRTGKSAKVLQDDVVPDSYFNNMATRFKNITSKFSPVDKYYKKAITSKTIYDAGRYYRLYEYEKENGKIESSNYAILSLIGRVEITNQTGLLQLYYDFNAWRKYFYGV